MRAARTTFLWPVNSYQRAYIYCTQCTYTSYIKHIRVLYTAVLINTQTIERQNGNGNGDTCDDESNRVDARWVDGNLTFVNALVTRPSELDLQSPVVGVLEMKRKSRIGAVRLHADCQQMKFLFVTSHPRHLLQMYNQ